MICLLLGTDTVRSGVRNLLVEKRQSPHSTAWRAAARI
ncbi:uncharacterized protein ANIA_11564 [Aspergillus nidulans FGSC A4]|uniref:Uncharacterized protein n=1 Tax=Emericella nidulans (strain FGSC A4 / ATCC 38163 / CBS 112.46 / NRRL 194 / M139) TaxID=227321 RepID=C8VBF9_EMENI|nr:hypothetical protein [Aspergillus nidulans FGSC A4]CBF79467.1 TPA: hypothetical protein ANIA_11564 [Aspergillus nidulans FGSC A4]